jgi:hypothetical protein
MTVCDLLMLLAKYRILPLQKTVFLQAWCSECINVKSLACIYLYSTKLDKV